MHDSDDDGGQESQPASGAGFDSYRSLVDFNIRIIVAKDVVPPFRFKAGGWDFSQSSTELGSTIKMRIAEKGFFMFRVNEHRTGGIELIENAYSGPKTETKAREGPVRRRPRPQLSPDVLTRE